MASSALSSILRKLGYTVLAVTLITGAGFALRGPQGVSGLREKLKEIDELQEQNATLTKEVQEKQDRIQQLKSNPAAQEEEIRRRYKLLKPGETTFILPDAPKTSPEPAPKN